ncbi:hypothetical protein DFP78_11672 [Photobacterium lutimaris]|nr:hypothetical protein DFP78_11672 [Photobacterium lutimaris]
MCNHGFDVNRTKCFTGYFGLGVYLCDDMDRYLCHGDTVIQYTLDLSSLAYLASKSGLQRYNYWLPWLRNRCV